MNKYFIILTIFAAGLLIPANLLAQINVVPIDGGYRFKPETKWLPTTNVTSTNLTSNNFSEPDYCTTPDLDTTEFKQLPWYGNPQYLEDLLDSVGYPDPCPTCRVEVGVRYRIPVVFWVYNNGAGTDVVPRDDQIRDALDHVNRDYRENDTGFRFYLACNGIRRINNDDWVETSNFESIGAPFERAAPNPNFVKGAINIHVVRNRQGLYNALVDAIFVSRNRVTTPARRSTLSHEIGHALGLLHTHHWEKWRGIPFVRRRLIEPIDHSRRQLRFIPPRNVRLCSVNGDALCDTPADPRLTDRFTFPACVYTGTQTDPWGDRYDNPPAGSGVPDPTNIMSYGGQCRLTLTREQIAVMVHRVERGRYRFMRNGYRTPDVTFDTAEPDNVFEQARNVALNAPEVYTFHRSYRRTGAPEFYRFGSNTYEACDVDWLWFRAGGFVRIETSDANQPNTADANTELQLFELNGGTAVLSGTLGARLTTDDNGGAGNFSRIERTLPFGNYAVQVINRSPNVTGYYTLEVATCPVPPNPTITGPTEVCGSATFQTNNTAGQPITWRTSNLSIVSGQGTTSLRVQSGSGGPSGWVEAVVGPAGCQVTTPRFGVAVGSAIPPPTGIRDPVSLGGTRYRLSLISPQPGVSYTWTVFGESSNVAVVSGQGSATVTVEAGNGCSIFARASFDNGCTGTSSIDRQFNICNNFTVFPNPTSDVLRVAMAPNNALRSENQSANQLAVAQDFNIKLYNPQNAMIAEANTKNGEVTLDVRNLPLGVYVLHILYQGEIYPHEVIIK